MTHWLWKVFVVVNMAVLGVSSYASMALRVAREGVELVPRGAIPVHPVKHFSQADARWGDDGLGRSSETMRRAGCLVTVLAANLRDAGVDVDPGTLNARLSGMDAYTRGGAVIWQRFARAIPGFGVRYRRVFSSRTVERDLRARRLPMVQVRRGLLFRTHWLLVVGADDASFLAMDPGRASTEPVPLSRFGRVHAYRLLVRR